ncbi:VOC family protein [Isoptericola sp. b490]|uniref:VOC family protein n=1 Tax=Actinotalea lenta TaxID=3064654 RepID=UPI00271335E5|nr:VOC family protein [Isoptericola sp. b490]MDO8121276.1 VOC family protein [Isoptericola sp. b490]
MAHGDITHTEIPVTDFAAASTFYGGLFGWDVQEAPGFEGYPMWRAPNGISGGGLVRRTEDFSSPRGYVEVDSIEEALVRVVELGGRVGHPRQPIDDASAWATIIDPDGNEIGLYEVSAPAA